MVYLFKEIAQSDTSAQKKNILANVFGQSWARCL